MVDACQKRQGADDGGEPREYQNVHYLYVLRAWTGVGMATSFPPKRG